MRQFVLRILALGLNAFCLTVLVASLNNVAPAEDASPFRFTDIDGRSVKITDGDQPVLTYNYGVITGENVPENDVRRQQACFIHPLWGLNGEVVTDAFPKDHYHHTGVFWRWPYVGVDGKDYDCWSEDQIQVRFVKWLDREAGPKLAELTAENGWFLGDRKVMIERVRLRVHPVADDMRAIDLDLTWIPVDRPISLLGRGGKSYGGLTARFACWPDRDGVVRYPGGVIKHETNRLETPGDLLNTRLPWVAMSAQFDEMPQRSTAAIFISPQHPDYPPSWLTRCYGPLCVGWPGVKAQTFEPGVPIHVAYRLLLGKREMEVDELQKAYDAYRAGASAVAK